jgi:bromodomain-containing factor 1
MARTSRTPIIKHALAMRIDSKAKHVAYSIANSSSHASEVKAIIATELAPLVNGNGKHTDHEPPHRVSAGEIVKDTQNLSSFISNQPMSIEPTSKSEVPDVPEVSKKPASEITPTEAPASKAVKDVEMADATTGGDEAEELMADAPPEASKEEAAAGPVAAPAEASEPTPLPVGKDDLIMEDEAAPALGTIEAVGGDEAAASVEGPAVIAQEVDLHPASMSQLAIDSIENESFSAPTTAEVSMTDAPDATEPTTQTSTKVAREREDEDMGEEPAAKRAKTESQDVEPTTQPSEIHAEMIDLKDVKSLEAIPGWTNTEVDNVPFTQYQIKEYRRAIAAIKKTKAGAMFKDSVSKLWPQLWNSYVERIDRPTDLSDIDRQVRDGSISTLSQFKDTLGLIYRNAVVFNGPEHDVTAAGLATVQQLWSKTSEVPPEEPPKSKAAPKQQPTRHTESRAAALPPPPPPPRRSSSGIAPTPVEKAPEETYAVPPGGVPQVRRASTHNDGDRPKRAIHPPKNKDLDYAPKTVNKKKLQPELRFCHEILEEMMDQKHFAINAPFLTPVDPVALQIPTYWKVIKNPMDLSTMSDKLGKGEYSSAKDFEKDMQLMIKNCVRFNGEDSPISAQAKQLETLFKAEWAKKDQWLAKNTPGKAASVEASSSHEEADTEDEEEEAAPAEAAANNSIIAGLQERLREESEKMNQLLFAPSIDEAMISVQQAVVATIQRSLLERRQQLAATQKTEKPAKSKPAKQTKAKSTGGSASKKAAGGAATGKKATNVGGGNKKAKKQLTAAEKDLIANAINDLESPSIEVAIDLIKKDTGQNVSSAPAFILPLLLLFSGVTDSDTCLHPFRRMTVANSNWTLSSCRTIAC